jgi:hypothetical protein
MARAVLERALAITEALHGPDHPDVATRLNNLGGILQELGQPEQARPPAGTRPGHHERVEIWQ